MTDIYANAEFVIAAVAPADSSEHLTVPQNPLVLNPCLVGVISRESKVGSWPDCCGGIFAMPMRNYGPEAMDDIRFSRFASRGWVFQEERLARRTLYFTENQIILQCNICRTRVKQLDWDNVASWSQAKFYDLMWPDIALTLYKTLHNFYWQHILSHDESNAGDEERGSRSTARHTMAPPSTEQDLGPEFTSPSGDVGGFEEPLEPSVWFDFVEAYTLRYLSQSSDRLPAIQGLATRIERQYQERSLDYKSIYCQGTVSYTHLTLPTKRIV